MITPTPISEITNVQGDANLYGGGTAVPIGESDTAKYIADAAQARADLNKYVSEAHEKRINDVLKQVNDLDIKDVLPSDMPAISANYASMMKDIADNHDVIANPNSDIQKYGDFRQRLASLQTQVATSAAHKAIVDEHKRVMALHPDLNTQENQQQIGNFENTPMGQRRDFLLKTPVTFDPSVAANAAAAATKKIVNQQELSHNKKYIVGKDGVYYDADEYNQNFNKILNSTTDSYGRTWMANLRQLYNQAPANADGTKEPFEQYVKEAGSGFLPKNNVAVTIKPNEVMANEERIAEERREANQHDKEFYANLDMQKEKAAQGKPGTINPKEGAEASRYLLYQAGEGNGISPEYLQTIWGSDPKQDIKITKPGTMTMGKDSAGNSVMIPGETGVQSLPRKEVQSIVPDGKGGFILNSVLNSQSGAPKKLQEHISYEQASSDVNRLFGPKFAPQIASGVSSFNNTVLHNPNAKHDDLKNYFEQKKAQAGAQAAPAAPVHKLKYNPSTGNFE